MQLEESPALYKVAELVTEFPGDLKKLTDEMFTLMYKSDGVGLAAPQVGISRQIIVIDDGTNIGALFNPRIIEHSEDLVESPEGCLSLPGQLYLLKRFKSVTVEYQDLTGNYSTIKAEDFLSIILQHEIDHLNGILISDKGILQTTA